jgi:hypothetical protein
VNFAGRNGVKITGDPYTRTIFFDTQVTAISTGIYGYSKFNVISNASTLKVDAVNNSNNIVLTAGSTSSVMNFIGLGDIVLNGHTTSNAVFIGISSFSSSNYLNISSLAYKTYGSTLSTVSSLFCDVKFLNEQISSWAAHGAPLAGAFEIFYNRFVIVAVDETYNGTSGCSIDASTGWLKKLGMELDINFFDRSIAYMSENELPSKNPEPTPVFFPKTNLPF